MVPRVHTYSNAEYPGIYVCISCGDAEHVFHEKGDEAPLCANCGGRPVTWEFRRPLQRRPIGFVIP